MNTRIWYPVFIVAAIHFVLHMVTSGGYGIFRDEYYYLACSHHLAWGYVDQPPLSIAVLAIVRSILGDGILAIRLIPAVCGASEVILGGYLAALLGGGRFAQSLAALSVAIAPVTLITTGFYSMNCFNIVFWTLTWIIITRCLVTERPHLWVLLGITVGFGLLNKIGLLIIAPALTISLILTQHRRVLATRWPYIATLIAAVIFLPHLIWQAANGWPTIEFVRNAQEYKIADMSPIAFLSEVALEQNPANVIIWAFGLAWLLFAAAANRYRVLGLTFLSCIILLIIQRSKPYYAAGFFPILLAGGACAWEAFLKKPKLRLVRPLVPLFCLLGGLFVLPMSIPILSPERLAAWQQWTGLAPAAQENDQNSVLPQYFSDRFGWRELAVKTNAALLEIPEEDAASAVVIASDYGLAGALEYWSRDYNLPPVFSGHNSYYMWLPDSLDIETVILIGWSAEDVAGVFNEVTPAGEIENRWAKEYGTPIVVARNPTITWSELKRRLRNFI